MKHVLNNGSLDVLRLTLAVATRMALFAFATADAAPPEGIGPLAVHPANSRYFVDAKGRTVWLTGSHTWAYFQERGIDGRTPDFDYEEYLGFLQERGHNFLRLWTWEHAQWMSFADKDTPVRYTPLAYQRTGPGRALDGKPKFDLTEFNEDFFGRLRVRVKAAGERGICVGVMLFQGFSVDKTRGNTKRGNAWHGHPFHSANNINNINGNPSGDDTGHDIHELKTPQVTRLQETYVRKMIDTLGDLENVLWEIGNECHRDSVAWQCHMIRFVKTYETTRSRQHPVGMTGAPINTKELLHSPADWISPRRGFWLTDPPVNEGQKVIVVDSDHCNPSNHDPSWVWKTLFRGHHFILMDWYRDYRLGSPKEPDSKWDVTRYAMGRARVLADRMDLAKLVPRPSLSSTKYCLANPTAPRITYAVYFPKGKSAEIDLTATKEVLGVEWFDPSSGKSESAEKVGGGARRTFRAPFRGPAILLLRSASGRSPQRTVGPSVQDPPEEVTSHRDIEYARAGEKSLLLDIYTPRVESYPPLVVWIHGGAWRKGSKGDGGRVRWMTDHGYAVVSINYRLSQEAVFPAQIHDCKAAIRWLRAHAEEYGYDADHIGVAGSSAGGHLVALLGTSGDVNELEGDLGDHLGQSSRVQAVCDMWGPTDFLQMGGGHDRPESPESLLIGGPIRENREKVAVANPITYVSRDDPPFLLLHGDKDGAVRIIQSELLKEALDKVSVPADFQVLEGAAHGGKGFSTEKMNEMILAFFNRRLK